eukprot:CAMPEP_0172449574 /NCGR_PEP_ID=MMETSP1065-20121228/8250_1 /TAXON_ID=265537 /ORGANISM="Amphiprora paludosa, Strain CCMP125" /LENGTH=1534 /DNA_ID=CAMNT_0013201277 /DNA_START=117 /DNA_END=4721 /DNA_ORIENTATION=+
MKDEYSTRVFPLGEKDETRDERTVEHAPVLEGKTIGLEYAEQSDRHMKHAPSGVSRHHRFLQTLLVLSLTLLQQRLASALTTSSPESSSSKTTAPTQSPLQVNENTEGKDDDDLLVTTHDDDEANPFSYSQNRFTLDQDEEDEEFISGQNQSNEADDKEDQILIVSTADGSLIGLSKSTGDLVWKQNGHQVFTNQHEKPTFQSTSNRKKSVVSESPSLLEPLVTTTTTAKSFSDRDWRTAAVPSLDGKTVYMTANMHNHRSGGADEDANPEVAVTTSIPDLVHRAPFVDNRGRIYNGSRTSIAVAVDGTTGAILKVISTNGDSLLDKDDEDGDDDDLHWEIQSDGKRRRRKVVWMGRVDHSISVHEPRSGSLDVSFSAAEIKSVRDMILGTNHQQPPWEASSASDSQLFLGSGEGSFASGIAGGENADDKNSPNSLWKAVTTSSGRSRLQEENTCSLLATPNGNLAYRNPSSGEIEWVSPIRFEAPVAFAVDANSGSTIPIDIVPDAVSSRDDSGEQSASEYLSKELSRQYNNLMKSPTEASLNEAAGAEKALTQTAVAKMDPLVGSLQNGQLFAMPLGNSGLSSQSHGIRTTGTASSSYTKPGVGSASSSSLLSSVVAVTGRPHTSYEHSLSSSSLAAATRPCLPGTDHFPACLVSSSVPMSSSHGALKNDESEHALVPFGQESSDAGDASSDTPPRQRPQQHRKYQKILMILSSWLPPLVAMVFVVSFELGRRKRQKDQGPVPEIGAISASGSLGEGVAAGGGVIQINHNVILGYGGHGTVVYEGMLEGRKVAVKRMLQAYSASADREISLLIESDGHPNVVRYFLKEVRGDFVYLALELCDLSLHDLIGHMRATYELMQKESWFEEENIAIPNAIRTVLLQIANGIKHLHGLRIVHRDLKPANILLADSRKSKRKGDMQESVFEIFGDGDYVAKISDMGLGKQLMGQSSYGGIGVGESSSHAQGHLLNGEGAESNTPSIVGAGPGTVGWQAPEVMVMRMPPSDNSVRSNESASGGFMSIGELSNACDCSPLDTSLSVRTSRSVDIFSLGCIFYSTLVPGSHPFGEWYEREANIMHNKPDLEALRNISLEAFDLVSLMLKRNPAMRPTARQVCDHPYFWSPDRRLLFLCDFSDRLETEGLGSTEDTVQVVGQSSNFAKIISVERNAVEVVGTAWDTALDDDLVHNVQRFRTYDPSSVRDLLRLIRNKYHHFEELPESMKSTMGSKTDGLSLYFERRFPGLLVHCFNICREILQADDPLCVKYSMLPAPRLRSVVLPTATIAESPGQEAAPPPMSQGQEIASEGVDFDDGAATPSMAIPGADTLISTPTSDSDVNTLRPELPPAELIASSSFEFEEYSSLIEREHVSAADAGDVVVWECSTAAKTFNNRGWYRSDDDWVRRTDASLVRKANSTLMRCMDDPKFRTRLCNHWDSNQGTFCPMRKKGKCVFAHGPVELRVKEAKRNRWGKLVDDNGNNKNPRHSGGEDTYGAARSIESERKQEGKWNLDAKGTKTGPNKGGRKGGTKKQNDQATA